MNECLIKAIDFDLFWKLSGLVLLSNALNGLYLLTHLKTVNETKQKINQNVGVDPGSGIPLAASYADQKLLNYNVGRRVSILLLCLALSGIFVFSYALLKDVPALSNSTAYKCLITVLTYVGLAPVVVSFLVAVFVFQYVNKMANHPINSK